MDELRRRSRSRLHQRDPTATSCLLSYPLMCAIPPPPHISPASHWLWKPRYVLACAPRPRLPTKTRAVSTPSPKSWSAQSHSQDSFPPKSYPRVHLGDDNLSPPACELAPSSHVDHTWTQSSAQSLDRTPSCMSASATGLDMKMSKPYGADEAEPGLVCHVRVRSTLPYTTASPPLELWNLFGPHARQTCGLCSLDTTTSARSMLPDVPAAAPWNTLYLLPNSTSETDSTCVWSQPRETETVTEAGAGPGIEGSSGRE